MKLPLSVFETIDLTLARKAFLLLSAISLFFIPVNALLIYMQKPGALPIASGSQKKTVQWEAEAAYTSAFDRSALFGTPPNISSSPLAQASARELIKDYRLKGIILGGEAEAIVEDAKTQKNMFVKIGSQLGDLTVKQIKEGLIVLDYLGGEIKLEIQ